MYTRRLMSIYKVYSIGRTWSWPVMSAPACFSNCYFGQLPRVSVEDPERKRVDSVFKTSVCLSVCSLIVSKFSHFLYYKVL